MRYCSQCAARMRWPTAGSPRLAQCELCGRRVLCYDTPSEALPKTRPQ